LEFGSNENCCAEKEEREQQAQKLKRVFRVPVAQV
jgi:hypothetical protein